MLKLILTLCFATFLAVVVLQLRHQRLELSYQTNQLHDQIRRSQARLWEQQLQIAGFTSPNAISKTVGDQKLNMVPQKVLSGHDVGWIEPAGNPDAE